jgi:hypothetical protein
MKYLPIKFSPIKFSPSLRAACRASALLAAFSLAAAAQVRQLPSPASERSAQANLTADHRGRVYLSWIDRTADNFFSLRFSTREGGGWSKPRTIAEGREWFVNWADFPSLAALPDGSLAAHWLVKSGAGTYAYDVTIARSFDGGRTWSKPFTPHRDRTQTEHGFVSMFPARGGLLGAVWLDGREMKASAEGHDHGDMNVRYAALARDGRAVEEAVLDRRVCECCQTSAALTEDGPVVVYRDRSDKEIRDIAVVRLKGGRWTEPRVVHADGWQIDACPVNGPSVSSDGRRRVAVAWFTGAGDEARVRVAFSNDQGDTFGAPAEVSVGGPTGRVGALMLEDGSAVVSWLERGKGGGEVRVRRVRPDGRMTEPVTVAASGTARSNGVPRMARAGGALVFAWVGGSRVLTAELPVAALDF